MLDALKKMRDESRSYTTGDQLRSILDAFEKTGGAEGANLDASLREVLQNKFGDRPGVTDDAQITPQARQRVAELLRLNEAMSKKAAEGEDVPAEEPPEEEPPAEVEVPAPEEGQAAEDMTLEQIADQYGLTPDEFLDFLSEESEDLEEAGAESSPEPEEPPAEEEVPATEEPPAEEPPEPEEPAEPEQTPKEVYEDIAKESALKIAAMKLGLASDTSTPSWVAPAAIGAGVVGLGTLGALKGPQAWSALKNWRSARAAAPAVADVAQAARGVDLPPMPQRAFGTQVPEGADEAARAAFQAKRDAERAAAIKTLGLGEGWTPAQVKQQHRVMIRGAHPDVAGAESTPTAAELNAAYEILKNGSLRSRVKLAMLRRAFGLNNGQETFGDRVQRLAKTGQLRLLNEW